MEDSDDDLPLAKRKKPAVKRKVESGDESDDEPKKKSKGFKREPSFDPYEDEEDDYERPSKKMKRPTPKNKKGVKKEEGSPQKKMTKKEKELEEGLLARFGRWRLRLMATTPMATPRKGEKRVRKEE